MPKIETLEKNIIGNTMFSELLNKVESGDDSCLDQVGIKAEYRNYSLDVYSDNGEVSISDFGFMSDSNWIECTPTQEQFKMINDLLNKEYKRLEEIERDNQYNRDNVLDLNETGLYGYGY